jgi:hypothetical protein
MMATRNARSQASDRWCLWLKRNNADSQALPATMENTMSNANLTTSNNGDQSARFHLESVQPLGKPPAEMAGRSQPNAEPTCEPATAPCRPANLAGDHDSDIQEYMSRLLTRTNSATHAPSLIPAPAKSSETPAVKPAIEESAPSPAWNPGEYVPKAIAPENSTNLQALREVANTSNRAAVRLFEHKKLKHKSATVGLQAMIAIVFSIVFLIVSSRPFDISMMLAIGCFIFSLLPLMRMVRHIRTAKSLSHLDSSADPSQSVRP